MFRSLLQSAVMPPQPVWGGGVLLQDEHSVAYASRSLTDAKSRYAQIEKELLAVQFSLERFNQYTYGERVTLSQITSHLRPLLKRHWHQHHQDCKESYSECRSMTTRWNTSQEENDQVWMARNKISTYNGTSSGWPRFNRKLTKTVFIQIHRAFRTRTLQTLFVSISSAAIFL